MKNRLVLALSILGILGIPSVVESQAVADSAARLLAEAGANQYQGSYSAEVVFVRESFLRGADSLRGSLEFNDPEGERRIRLEGRDEALEWWSRNFGQEQWWKDDKTERLRRIPFRSLKKPAFSSLLSYEDLLKLPAGYLMNFQSCQFLAETDSTYRISVLPKPELQTRYAYLDITLRKKPVLLQGVVFFGANGRRLKSLEVTGYHPESDKFLPTGLRVFDSDSLSSLRFSLLNPKLSGPAVAGSDKTAASQAAILSRIMGRLTEQAKIESPEAEDSTDAEESATQ